MLNFKQLRITEVHNPFTISLNKAKKTCSLVRKVTVFLALKNICQKFFSIFFPKFWLESCKSAELDHRGTQHNAKYHDLSPALTAPSPKTLIATRLRLRDWRLVKSSFSRHGQGPHTFIHAGAYKKLCRSSHKHVRDRIFKLVYENSTWCIFIEFAPCYFRTIHED